MQQIKLLPVMSASHIRALFQVHYALLSIQLPVNEFGKVLENGHVLKPMPPAWQTQLELLTPGFDLTQTWLLH